MNAITYTNDETHESPSAVYVPDANDLIHLDQSSHCLYFTQQAFGADLVSWEWEESEVLMLEQVTTDGDMKNHKFIISQLLRLELWSRSFWAKTKCLQDSQVFLGL